MNGIGQTLLIIGGLLAIGGGLREIRGLSRMRRSGIHAEGMVLRHEITGHEDNSTTYAPVVAYHDERGNPREFRSRLTSSARNPAEGSRVRVVYLPGRPDTLSYKVTTLSLLFGVGIAFLVVAAFWLR
ncbi:DUF3592 domain-containing protein [Streptomyces sp. R-74717]|uniref:DUF3592 domain-containing protein n=1 Tax=Streptomyces TaxID=1883 RepID=UPI003789F97E